ncbi:MAG: hypothetical protein JSS02_14160 [Planctomycetes bacterium]|nr:hypothetical protein [Planctomycetota bacterium]
MTKRAVLLSFALAILGTASADAAVISSGYYTHYNVHMDPGTLSVTGIVKFEQTTNGGGSSWPNRVAGGGSEGADTTIDQVFASNTPRISAFFMGMSYTGYAGTDFPDYPNPPDVGINDKHLVLFVSNAAAAGMLGQSFETVFAGYQESDVISWLEIVGQKGVDTVGQEAFNLAANSLGQFASDAAELNPSAWFDIPGTQAVDPGQFTVVSFSEGTQVGSGTVTQTGSAPVPEPSSLVMGVFMSVGGALVALRRRRRSQSSIS